MGTNHLIFRNKSYNQSYKIILVPSVLVIQLPNVILINIILKTCALFLNMVYYSTSQIHDICFNVLMTLFNLFIVYSDAFI